jgi:predicted ester cyclase
MSEQNKDLVRRYYDQVINGGNLDAVGDYFADERTAAGVRKGCFYFFQGFPDLHCSLDEFIAEGDRVFLRSTMTGTHDGEFQGIPATGHHIAIESAEIFRIADGNFVGYWCVVDAASLMRQLTEEPVAARA